MAEFTIILAFLAGLVSFLSPCVLPLVPAYLTFLAKTSVDEIKKDSVKARTKIFLSSLSFVIGFSLVFSLLGVLLQSILSDVAYELRTYLGYIGGTIIIGFGLVLLGIINLDFLKQEHKLQVKQSGNPYLSSFIFGAAFAVGWTPCVGAVLGGILTLAVTQPGSAFPLMLSYSLGLGIPFLFVGIFISQSSDAIKRIEPHLKWLNIIFGIILIILGILVFTDQLSAVANFAPVNDLLLS
ncbi:MAG TPA: cytochrome c biogenesis protein CcdA [Candidatus Bilamarchaeaceae archaeon]|nr:cytochrome c biogenesis protein CcdA [Candidatus Bilamarchaeaceae archaeon]